MYFAGSLRKWVITNFYPLLWQQDELCIQIGGKVDSEENTEPLKLVKDRCST